MKSRTFQAVVAGVVLVWASAAYPEVYEQGPIVAVFGKPMTARGTPGEASDAWLAEFGETLGVPGLDLRLQRSNAVHFGRFTVFAYQQYMEELPVENGLARLLVLNGLPDRVVYFGGKLARPPEGGFRADTVDAATAQARVRAMPAYATLTEWSAPQLVVFYEAESALAVRTWKLSGRRPGPPRPEAYTFFVNAADGRLVHVRDDILQADVSGNVRGEATRGSAAASPSRADVTGHVRGMATPGVLPDVPYNPPVETVMESAPVSAVGCGGTFTDENGAYTLPCGPWPASVRSDLNGPWVRVFNDQGDELQHQTIVMPPATLDFLFNPWPEEFTTSQVNCFIQATRVHDFYKARQPDFVGLDMAIPCSCNSESWLEHCNAFFDPSDPSINFLPAGEGCPNTAYTSVIAHEYGHFIVDRLGLGQESFGEGFSDTVGVLVYDDPVSGRAWRGPGTYVRHIALANKQYPCLGEIHDCGQVLAGCWWDIRLELQAALGNPAGLETARQLFTDWSQTTLGGLGNDSAHPQTAVEVLTVDDDDGDLSNGTPHDCAIIQGFRAHGIEVYTPLVDCDADGTPDICQRLPDCNTNGLWDVCDIVPLGASADCNGNRIPDDCERDCNDNGTPDDCDVTVRDCNHNGVPDDCDAARQDCNGNHLPDECDITAGSSSDCDGNGIPDECEPDCDSNGAVDGCELGIGHALDCNGNGVPDSCDIAAGISLDANTNGIPDECDVHVCYDLWDGFQPNPPFSFQRPLAEVDYDGDGVFWDVPKNNAVIFAPGCQTGTPFDNAVRVSVDTSDANHPEYGYVGSEYFRTVNQNLECGAALYSLSFSFKITSTMASQYDWEYFLYDARRGTPVIQLEFTSTVSQRVPAAQRGTILVKDPWPVPTFTSTHVTLSLNTCYDIEVVLDNRMETPDTQRVQVFVNGVLKVITGRWDPAARRMHDFRLQPVNNNATTSGSPLFWLDDFQLCEDGPALMDWADCNHNCVADASDIANRLRPDCNSNGIPDDCEAQRDCNYNDVPDICDVGAGTSVDCNTNGRPDECEAAILHNCCSTGHGAGCNEPFIAACVCAYDDYCCETYWGYYCVWLIQWLECGTCVAHDCNQNNVPDDCDLQAGTSADCMGNGIPDDCEPDCNANGIADRCEIAAGTSADCNHNGIPDACDFVAGTSRDCNGNALADWCDIHAGTSRDCDENGVPDECEIPTRDCNSNSIPDACDVAAGTSSDCNGNHAPDECEPDCNANGVVDACDIANGTSADCNGNDVPDGCDTASGSSHDCNANSTPDECEFLSGMIVEPLGGYNTSGTAVGVFVSGVYTYVADGSAGLQIIDVSNPAAPVRVGGCNTSGWGNNVVVSGSYAYVADGNRGLQVIDISNPVVPVYMGGYDTSGYAWDVAVVGTYAYVADSDAGLQVIDVSDPSAPVRVGGYDTSEYACGVSVVGLYAYVADYAAGLLLFDISNPSMPTQVGVYNTSGYARTVHVAGAYAYVADESAGLQIIDISHPAAPLGVGAYNTSGSARRVALSGRYAVVADYTAGVQVVDVSNPASPSLVAGYDTDGITYGVAAAGDYVYVGDGDAGLLTLSLPRAVDCNANGVLDECELAGGTSEDCNLNERPDECDLIGGTSQDTDTNGIPDECQGVQLIATMPTAESTLWRSARNTTRLTFDGDIATPSLGHLRIQQMLDGGGFGPDLSGGFGFTVENDGQGRPRILRVRETGATTVLTDGTWVAVRRPAGAGGWAGVSPFVVEYAVQVGDVNADGAVSAADLSAIFPKIPTAAAADQERADVNGDGKVLATDLSAVFPHIPTPPVPKPGGH